MRNSLAFIYLLITFSGLPAHLVCAQTVIGTVYKLPANAVLSELPWRDSIYVLRGFQDGNVVMPNGAPGPTMKLNYNAYMGRLQTISPKGDIIELKNFQGFSLITIGSHLFYNDPVKGFLELQGKGPVFLAVKTIFKGVTQMSSGQTFRTSDQRETTSRFDRLYTKNELYFFMDPDKSMPAATKLNMKKIFPKSRDALVEFADSVRIDFRRRRQLLRLLSFANELEANTKEDTIFYKVKSGVSPFATSWRDSVYRYRNFSEGRVTYTNDAAARSFEKMNFNQLTGNIDFITSNGDTLSEENSGNVKLVLIDDHQLRYLPSSGFVEINMQGPLSLLSSSRLDLVKKEVLVEEHQEKSSLSSSLATNRHQYLFYKKKTKYFFVDRHNHFLPATKSALLQLYPHQTKKIVDFINEHHTNFKSGKDLTLLTGFVNTSSISL